jgi:predicted Zn-dependent protease
MKPRRASVGRGDDNFKTDVVRVGARSFGPTITRRRWCGGLIAALGTLSLGGCATVSPEDERQLGGEEARNVERTVGLVHDARAVDYVGQVAQRLAATAARNDLTWSFNVADGPESNAFALPGGWVYVTRGLLALVNREDELAGVLGHEMGHVLARHAAQQVSTATPFAVLFGAPAALIGRVSPALGSVVGGTGRLAAGLVLAPYSREQEREADRLGMELAARSGWDPLGLSGFLETLAAEDALAGQPPDRAPFLSTHPSTPDRVKGMAAVAGSFTRAAVPAIAGSRSALLGRLEGLLIGDNPAYGAFDGSALRHPTYDLALEMPAGWKTRRSPELAGAIAPDADALVFLQMVTGAEDPVSGARADGLSDRLIAKLERVEISGLRGARLVADSGEGERLYLTWIAHRRRVVRIAAVSEIRDWERYRDAIDKVVKSVHPLSAAERDRIVELRLRVQPARTGETVAQLSARYGTAWSAARVAVANGLTVSTRLEAGWPMKIALRERFSPSAVQQ